MGVASCHVHYQVIVPAGRMHTIGSSCDFDGMVPVFALRAPGHLKDGGRDHDTFC